MTGPAIALSHDSLGHAGTTHSIFVGLDGLRGVAALAVVVWHAKELFGFRPASGYLAVDLFFVMSGFVIAHSYDGRMAAGLGARAFLRIRLIRLYPLYLLGLALAVAGVLASFVLHAGTNWRAGTLAISALLTAFYLPTPPSFYTNGATFPLNPPSWSLLFEMLINLAYALCFPLLTTRLLALVTIGGAVALLAATVAYGSLNTGFVWPLFAGGFPRVLFSFTAGVLLLRFVRTGTLSLDLGWAPPVALVLAILCFGPPAAWRATYDLVAALVLFPLATLAAVSAHPKASARAQQLLGLTSYPVYVLHVPLLAIAASGITKVLHVPLTAVQPWGGVALVITVLLLAWAAARLYDQPVRRLIATRLLRVSSASKPH